MDPSTERAEDCPADVAQPVTKSLDDDPLVGRQPPGRLALVVLLEETTPRGDIVNRYYRLSQTGALPPRRIHDRPRSLQKGTTLFAEYKVQQEWPKLTFNVVLDAAKERALNNELLAYSLREHKDDAVFSSVPATITIELYRQRSGALLLWKGVRVLHPYMGETTYEFEPPKLSYASISPSGRRMVVCWIEAEQFEYVLLPLSNGRTNANSIRPAQSSTPR